MQIHFILLGFVRSHIALAHPIWKLIKKATDLGEV